MAYGSNPWDLSGIILSNQAGANIARGVESAGNSIGQGIQQYQQNKMMAAQATAEFEAAISANPEMLQYLQSPNAPKDVASAAKKLQAGGAASFKDAAALAQFSRTYQQEKQRSAQMEAFKQDQEKRAMEIARNRFLMQQEQQNAAALRGAFASPMAQAIKGGAKFEQLGGLPSQVSASQAARNYINAGGVPDSATSQFFNAALDAESVQAGMNQPRQRYRQTGPVMDKAGKFLGFGAFDQATGEVGLLDEAGAWKPLPEDAEPVTATGMQKQVPSISEFRKMKGELTDAEISLRNMDRYIKSVGDASMGIQRLADKFSAGIKTLVGEKKLDPQELAAKMAQGQLQGLLGANRTNVVGGGVMTEQDALRIIERLGGDFGALSNPEVVRQAIAQVYSDRYKQYDDAFNFYNAAVQDYYGARGFKAAERVSYRDFASGTEDDQAVKPLSITSIKLVE